MRNLFPCLSLLGLLSVPEISTVVPQVLPATVQVVDGIPWTVVTVDLRLHSMALVGQAPGDPHDFAGLKNYLGAQGRRLLVATNAGIFETIHEPSGLFVEAGQVRHPLNLREGTGNFYMSPNGVFWIDDAGAHVAPSSAYQPGPGLVLATQSGPLLVDHGKLHPRLDPDSNSIRTRNAVAILDPWTVALIYSDTMVNLYSLAEFSRKNLGSEEVLYLDGSISALCLEGQRCPSGEWAGMLVVSDNR